MQLTIPSGVIKWFFYAETGVGDLKIDKHGRLTRGKLKGYLFATWKRVSCCVDYPYVPAFYAALAAIKAACI